MSIEILTAFQVIFVFLDFFLFCGSVVGNSVVIYVIMNFKVKSKSQCLILSVAIADLQIGLFGIPFFMMRVSTSDQTMHSKKPKRKHLKNFCYADDLYPTHFLF